MRKSRFAEIQIAVVIKEYDTGKPLVDICHTLGINANTRYNWKKKYGVMDTEMLRRYKNLKRGGCAAVNASYYCILQPEESYCRIG